MGVGGGCEGMMQDHELIKTVVSTVSKQNIFVKIKLIIT